MTHRRPGQGGQWSRVGAGGGGVRLDRHAVRGGGLCRGYSLLATELLPGPPLPLLCPPGVCLGSDTLGDGGFINRTSSLPFSTLGRTQCSPHKFQAPRRAACPCPGQLSTHLPGRGVTSGLLVLCPWAHSQISPSTAPHSPTSTAVTRPVYHSLAHTHLHAAPYLRVGAGLESEKWKH